VLVEQIAFADPTLLIPQPAPIAPPTVASEVAEDKVARQMYTGVKYKNMLVRIAGDHPMKGRYGMIVDHHEETVHERDARVAIRSGKGKVPAAAKDPAAAAKEHSSDGQCPVVFTIRLDHSNETFSADETCVWHRS
jgi:hypothetical protein